MRIYNCFWNWMLGHRTCHTSVGLVILKLGLRPSLILDKKNCCFWTWMLGHWTCHFGAGPWPSFVLDSKLWFFRTWSRSFSFRRIDKLWLFLDLDHGALDLSSWSWAFGPASFLIRNYDCFWTWMLGHWTCHTSVGLVILKLGLRPSFILNEKL